MTNAERLEAVQNRLDTILESAPDNPVYEEHQARSIYNYLQSIKLLEEMIRKEDLNV